MWVRFLGEEDPLEMGMTTHFSILAWKIPWDAAAVLTGGRACNVSDGEWL